MARWLSASPARSGSFSLRSSLLLAAVAGMVVASLAWPASAGATAIPLSGWRSPAAVPSAKTNSDAPALVTYAGQLYAFWTGQSSPYHIWYASFNGTSWSSQASIPSALTNYETGPTAVVYEGLLYVFWQGQSLPLPLWYATFNGSTWSSQTELSSFDAFNSSIAGATVYGGNLYLSWLNDSTFDVDYADWNGTAWSSAAAVPSAVGDNYESDDVPLAVFKGDLYVGWESSARDMMDASYNGSTWSSAQNLGAENAGPAFTTFGGKLYLVFGSNSLLVSYRSFNGTSWSGVRTVPDSSYVVESGPGTAVYAGRIYVAWAPDSAPSPVDYASKA